MTGRRWLGALTLFLTLLTTSSYASGPLVQSRALGTVMLGAPSAVKINGAPALSGTTLFGGDVLETGKASTAVVRLRSGASLTMIENSEVALEQADPAAGTEKLSLHRGAINLRNPQARPAWVTVPGASVLVESAGGFPALCRIAAVGQSSAIINDRGRVEIRGAGAPLILPMGQHTTLEAGRPQAGGQPRAGEVNAEIPRGTVKHAGQTPVPLNLHDAVFVQDVVETERMGRVRILLTGGSELNIGARSQMTITNLNVQSQQTTLELTAGKLRSQVQKLAPKGSFTVNTNTAVIGVVGTHFLVAAGPKTTRVWCFEGLVQVRNINPAVVGLVVLHAGEFTTVPLAATPAAASGVSPSAMRAQINQTDATMATAGVGAAANVASLASVGADAGAAAGAGVAASHADSAKNSADQALSALNSVTTSLSSASTNAQSALNSANSANQAVGNTTGILTNLTQTLVSPTYPCGCH